MLKVLAAGQSNALGRGIGGTAFSSVDPRVKVWNNVNPRGDNGLAFIEPVEAADPFDPSGANNFGLWFCHHAAVDRDENVRYVLCAEGGRAIEHFIPGGSNWDSIVAVHEANALGPYDVLLWHQGEKNGNSTGALYSTKSEYKAWFRSMVTGLREDSVIARSAPVLVGGIYMATAAVIDAALRELADEDPLVYYVDVSGLTSEDGVHFTGESLVTLGERYWEAYELALADASVAFNVGFAEDAKLPGTTPMSIVELDLERCTNVYGTAPCQAAVGITGEQKCFNTRKTCQDREHFVPATVTYRFAQARAGLPLDLAALPYLVEASSSPTELDVGGGLGVRGQVEIVMLDAPHHDRGNALLRLDAGDFMRDIDPYGVEQEHEYATNHALWSADISQGVWGSNQGISAIEEANSYFEHPNAQAQKVTTAGDGTDQSRHQIVGDFSAGGWNVAMCVLEQGTASEAFISLRDTTAGVWVNRIRLVFGTGVATVIAGTATPYAEKLTDTGPNGGAVWLVLGASDVSSFTESNARRIQIYPTGSNNSNYSFVHLGQVMEFDHEPTAEELANLVPIITGAEPVTQLVRTVNVPGRSYDPLEQGTFWGKFLARNPFYQGRPMRVLDGFMVDGRILENRMEVRHYNIERIDGPGDGVRILGKDPLKLASDDRARYPEPSTGVLEADIDDSVTEFGVTGGTYPDEGKIRLGTEIMSYTRAGSTFTVVRGIDNTTAASQREGATVQLVAEFDSESVPDILEELFTAAGISSEFMPKAAWDEEQTDHIGFLFSAQISAPTGISSLVESLLAASGAFVWYDERAQQIRLRALRPTPPISQIPKLDDMDAFLKGSVEVVRREDLRLSQVWYARGLINSTGDIDQLSNYDVVTVHADPDSESSEEYGQTRQKVIYGRWLPTGAPAAALRVAERTLARFRDTPREIRFAIDPRDWSIWVGDLVACRHRNLQDASGDTPYVPFQITRARYNGRDRVEFTALEYQVAAPADDTPTLIIDADAVNYNIRDEYENQIAPITDEDTPITVRVVVQAGVVVSGRPAIYGGGLPEGSVVQLENSGRILADGGRGGGGGRASSVLDGGVYTLLVAAGADGEAGGDAIEMTEDWVITNEGEIFAGGGGGGGGGGAVAEGVAYSGGGGGTGRGGRTIAGGGGGNAVVEPPGSPVAGDAGDAGTIDGGGEGGDGGTPYGGDGGTGGNFASAGTSGTDGTPPAGTNPQFAGRGSGGAAGRAVVTNGHVVTFESGGPGDSSVFKGSVVTA